MVLAFQQGGSYNVVNYGEYVIIDTIVNSNHYGSPQNGIIYRRGMNYTENFNPNGIALNDNQTVSKEDEDENGNKRYYVVEYDEQGNQRITFNEEAYKSALSAFVQNPGGGAEYVGQIVGPQGEVPELSILSWDDFLERYQAEDAVDVNKGALDGYGSPGATFDEEGVVEQDSIIDYIKYGYLDIIDQDGNITGAYISMDIPYPVFKYHAESIEPYERGYAEYDTDQQVWKYTNLISEDGISQEHNFFWQYDIKVPKGIRGQDLEKFDIDIDPTLISQDGNDVLPGEDNNNYRYYRIYRNYQRSAEGEPTKEYINSWQRTIHKITDNGNIPDYDLIQRGEGYSAGDRVAANGLKHGLFLLALTDGTTALESLPPLETYEKNKTFLDGTVTWQVIEDTISSPNLITVHYTHGDNDTVRVRLLDDIIINQQNGRIYAKYSDLESSVYLGDNQSIMSVDYIDTPWIDPRGVRHTIDRLRIKFNTYNYDADGRIVVNSNYSLDSQGNIIYPTTDATGRRVQFIDEQFKFVDSIRTDENTKRVTAYYNDGTSTYLGTLKAIDNISVENEGDLGQAKYWKVQYNNQLPDGTYETEYIDQNPLNEIACIQQYGDNIILLYSDPTVRQDLYVQGRDYAIPNTTYNIPNYDNFTGNDDGNGNLYWINLGSIYHSNHIFGKFSSKAQLESQYQYGFDKDNQGQLVPQNKDFAGWIATVQENGVITNYAYDYHGNAGWYKLADLSASNIDPTWTLVISQPDSDPQYSWRPPLSQHQSLNENGYWFVVSERTD